MGYFIAFLIVWIILAILIVLLIAGIPSSGPGPTNGDVVKGVLWMGVVAAVLVFTASGVINFFT